MSNKKLSDAVAPSRKEGIKYHGEKNYGRVEPFVPKPRANEYNDTGVEAAADRVVNNPQLEKLYANAPGTVARGTARPAASKTLVEAVCTVCEATAMVEPIYATAGYRCNSCFKPEGRRRR
jgi:hypothetical protein